MPQYDFRSLSPIDFEILVRDLLQEELGIRLETFKTGKDLGIDFRYCRDKRHSLIVQCKHYVESGYDAMLYVLKKSELQKVRRLNPSCYVFATSVALTPVQRDEIKAVFSPYIKSSDDIFGKDDLNNLLGKYPRIERQTLKLWLASVNVLEEVLYARIKNATRYEIDKIREHAKFYVQNKSFSDALNILRKFNFCIIAGIPGIGKTILAEMLLLYYSRHDYEVIKVSNDISEAWSLDHQVGKKVFYYDDFLGQTSFVEKLHKNEDQRLVDFIHAVRKSRGIKLILTTREYVLNQARQQYEKLDRERFDNQKCIIDIGKYTRLNRARILYNHIYFAGLPERYRAAIIENNSYLRIIDHQNYNPRIIQLMTEYARIRDVKPSDYVGFFLNNLENPFEVWGHAFKRHLSQSARNVLIALVSMPFEVFMDDLQRAFQAYNLAYAQQYDTEIGPQGFMSALRELDGDFLVYEKTGSETIVKYHNPSVRDFVKQYLTESPEELKLLTISAVFYEQLDFLWHWEGVNSGRGIFFAFACENPIKCVSKVREILNAPPTLVINVKRANLTRKERWPTSSEKKAYLLASIVNQGVDCLLPVLMELIESLEARLGEKVAQRNDLTVLLKQLLALTTHPPTKVSSFVDRAKRFLLSVPYWATDLKPLCDLMKNCPYVFSDEDRIQARTVVRKVAESIASESWSDLEPQFLMEEASALRSVAERLDVDIEEQIKAIESQAEKLESKQNYEPEEPEYSGGKSNEGDWCSDDDIASLFSTLQGTTN